MINKDTGISLQKGNPYGQSREGLEALGFQIASIADIVELSFSRRIPNETFHTSDAIVYPSKGSSNTGKFKVSIRDSRLANASKEQPLREGGVIYITDQEYERHPGVEFVMLGITPSFFGRLLAQRKENYAIEERRFRDVRDWNKRYLNSNATRLDSEICKNRYPDEGIRSDLWLALLGCQFDVYYQEPNGSVKDLRERMVNKIDHPSTGSMRVGVGNEFDKARISPLAIAVKSYAVFDGGFFHTQAALVGYKGS